MPDLLLELFSEEIPARMQCRAAADLQRLVQERLFDAGFMIESSKAFATPRRLTLVIEGLPAIQPDLREEKKGPRTDAPEKALQGFMRANGLESLNDCEKRQDARGSFYVVIKEEKGRPTADLIAQAMPDIIEKFPWQKSMRWGERRLRWVRPLKSILCAFDGEVVPFEIEGITSGDVTQGHRFLGSGTLKARHFEIYETALHQQKVILSSEERAQRIHQDAVTLCEAQTLELVEDKALLDEVAGLSEWPISMIGSFDEKFLALPDEVLIASMKGHQKYFSVYDPKTNKLSNKFIFVVNIEAPDGGAAMRQGYERVLAARLSDAWFLYRKDLKTSLTVQAEKLDTITFFKGLGSQGDKMRRVIKRACDIAPVVGADSEMVALAARLAKADLVTEMVGEFASLQGIMGRYYASSENLPSAVSDALKDHYKPAGPSDEVPTAPVSVALALADRLDTLISFWSIDEKPSGSRDPFALRRAATGVVQLILKNDVRLVLPSGDLRGFLFERLKVLLADDGFTISHIEAVAYEADGSLRADFAGLKRRLVALRRFVDVMDGGTEVLQAVKRVSNILKAEEKKYDSFSLEAVTETLLSEPAEMALFEIICDINKDVYTFVKEENFDEAFEALIPLATPLDHFFDAVIVNAAAPEVRHNRLALLNFIESTCLELAEFSRIDG